MTKPIHIAGGGLCGLTLGIGLRRKGLPVVLYEAGDYPRHKVCGEFICGVERDTLRELGIDDLLADAAKPKTVAWFDRTEQLRSDSLPIEAYGISRYKLDQRLADRFVSLGGELKTKSRCRQLDREAWVDCTGRHPNRKSKWIGLKCHLEDIQLKADLEMHMCSEGYVGLNEVESKQFNLCGLFRRRNIRARHGEPLIAAYLQACGLKAIEKRIKEARLVVSSECAVAALDYGTATNSVQPYHCVLGDAYGLIPPFTGNGMSIAFQSAALALPHLTDYANGVLSWNDLCEQIRNEQSTHFVPRIQRAQRLHKWITHPLRLRLTWQFAKTPFFPFQSLFHATH